LLGNYIFIVAQRSLRWPYTLLLIELPTPVILLKLMTTPHDQNRDIFWNILVLDSTCQILLLVSCIEIEKLLLILFQWLTIRILFKLKHIHSDFCFKQF
jgi:hypothetical protein